MPKGIAGSKETSEPITDAKSLVLGWGLVRKVSILIKTILLLSGFILTHIVVEPIRKPKNSMDWSGSKTEFLVWMVNPDDVSQFIVVLTFWLHCSFIAPCKYQSSANETDSKPCFCKTEKGVLGFS